MKISQEVRDFAAKQEADKSAPAFAGEGDHPQDGGGADAPIGAHPELVEGPTLAEAEAGMAEMSERYREGGNELYIGAGGRERD